MCRRRSVTDGGVVHIRWTLRKKILLGFGTNLFLIVIALLWAIGNQLMLGRASDAVLSTNFKSILAAENMIDSLERQDSAMLMIMLELDDNGLEQFRLNESSFLQWLGRAKDTVTIPGENEIVTEIDRDYAKYLIGFTQIQRMQSRGDADIRKYYSETIYPLLLGLRKECFDLRELNQGTMFSSSSHVRFISDRAIVSTIVIGVALIVAGLSFSFFLSNIIVEPLLKLVDATKSISEGNYHIRVQTKATDELGTLAGEFNTMVQRLRGYNDMNIEQIVSEKHKNDTILRTIEDGIIVVNSDYRISNINLSAAAILKVNPEFITGKHFLEVIDNKELFEQIRRSIETGTAPDIVNGKNILSVQKEGLRRYYLFSLAAIHSRADAMAGVVLLFKDITRIKELDDMKSEFVMTASHELRTPLTSIEMGVKLIRENTEGVLSEGDEEVLSAVQDEIQRLKNLVNDLLDISRIEAGKLDVHRDEADVAELCARALDAMGHQTREKELEPVCTMEKGTIPKVLADEEKILWVLTNLLANAVRYSPVGGRIEVSAEPAGSFVHISVRDYGPGIPYEFQSKIFEKFVQVKDGKEHSGTGLGLSICKEIVHIHGGAIWVDSVPGEGSTFTFTLPVAGV